MARPLSIALVVTPLAAFALVADAALPQPSDDLLRARSFCMGCATATGRVISGDDAFRILVRRSDAATQLEAVFARGNIQAQMYALAGLREIDYARFERAFSRMRGRNFSVVTVATVDPVTSYAERGELVLRRIRSGDYKLVVDLWRSGKLFRR